MAQTTLQKSCLPNKPKLNLEDQGEFLEMHVGLRLLNKKARAIPNWPTNAQFRTKHGGLIWCQSTINGVTTCANNIICVETLN